MIPRHARSERGATLVEIVVGSAIGLLVVGLIMTLMVSEFKQGAEFEKVNEGWIGAVSTATPLILLIKNTARLSPKEDLVATDDDLYSGFEGLKKDEYPSKCRKGEKFSAFRLTSVLRNVPLERTYRMWKASSAGLKKPTDELRMTFDPVKSGFAMATPPKELYIVDADTYYMRRYRVVDFKIHKNVLNDPFDDLPKKDANGKNMKFTYVSVFLKRPLNAKSAEIAEAKNINFITDSIVYASETSVLCISGKDYKNLIKVSQSGYPDKNLFTLNDRDLSLSGFRISLASSSKTKRNDEWPRYPTKRDAPSGLNPDCTDHVEFEIALTKDKILTKDSQNSVTLVRPMLLDNFNVSKPPTCI